MSMSENKVYVGWDNGVTGGIAIIYPDGGVVFHRTPTLEASHGRIIDDIACRRILLDAARRGPLVVIFEIGQKNPTLATKWNYSQGESYGVVRTILRQNGIAAYGVNPKDWQHEMHRGFRPAGTDTKMASFAACKALFPKFPVPVSPRAKKPHDGCADALLMAAWGKRHKL